MILGCRFPNWEVTDLPRAGGARNVISVLRNWRCPIFFRSRHHPSRNPLIPLSLDTTFPRQYTVFIR
jgi:hypothetical protein